MLRRWHVLLLILVTVTAFCGLAAAKLRATPKYDRIQVGMSLPEVKAPLGEPDGWISWGINPQRDAAPGMWDVDEGVVIVGFVLEHEDKDGDASGARVVADKILLRRGPLERLAWLAGWRG